MVVASSRKSGVPLSHALRHEIRPRSCPLRRSQFGQLAFWRDGSPWKTWLGRFRCAARNPGGPGARAARARPPSALAVAARACAIQTATGRAARFAAAGRPDRLRAPPGPVHRVTPARLSAQIRSGPRSGCDQIADRSRDATRAVDEDRRRWKPAPMPEPRRIRPFRRQSRVRACVQRSGNLGRLRGRGPAGRAARRAPSASSHARRLRRRARRPDRSGDRGIAAGMSRLLLVRSNGLRGADRRRALGPPLDAARNSASVRPSVSWKASDRGRSASTPPAVRR